ncbi:MULTISPECIES: hypothetical protein [Pseudomonas]|uniref:Uncharacterized protein n=1 Tax=Pseudomonas taiwanensis TaxID=470150 RepID=A0ABR6VA70_9PSED|nr:MULTISPECIES: hypothetical protein [Pseudomonas]AGZ36232.1 hypothetical protein PVLB_17255 [Pseudomonas sp. VLB120]MBC3477376.1 hypothetical protein [Pseudomonas taiwanensis]MBC3492862.1 hypothetical protein [Pseudomonas taiwanensis]MDT8924390.1 hypothetical protein [Pseudomonas taiwanensis]
MTAANQVGAARECAALLRLGRDVEGAVRMVELFDAVLAQVDAGAGAVVLQAMLDAQQRQDWLALADYLEYELVHLIEQGASR